MNPKVSHLHPIYRQIANKYAKQKFRDYGIFGLSVKEIAKVMKSTKLGSEDIEVFEAQPEVLAVLAHSKQGEDFLNKLRTYLPDETAELMETDLY